MSILSELLQVILVEKQLDLTELPENTIKDIKKYIHKGANDEDHHWSSALELAHFGYAQAHVERPTPDMDKAWKQYEAMIKYSVDQLSDARGLHGEWRITEDVAPDNVYQVDQYSDGLKLGYEVSAKSLKLAINKVLLKIDPKFGIPFLDKEDGALVIRFHKHHVLQQTKVYVHLKNVI